MAPNSCRIPTMPARHRHLENAPIREALIDIRVPQVAELPDELRGVILGRLGARYQAGQAQRLGLMQARIAAGQRSPTLTTTDRAYGWMFRNVDGTNVVQFR